jgi:NHLM bacteriocin system secretion protein
MGVAYFPDKDGRTIKAGMEVQVTPSMVKRERYGGILGKVTEVSSFPVTNQDITALVGSTELAQSLSGQEPKIQILAKLETDPSNTNNGYKWSSSKGPQIQLKTGTTVQVRIRVGDKRPISYVLPILRSLTGVD